MASFHPSIRLDDKPRWTHGGVADVDSAEVEACFAPLGDRELRFEEHVGALSSVGIGQHVQAAPPPCPAA